MSMDLIKVLGGLTVIAGLCLWMSTVICNITIRLVLEAKTIEQAHSRGVTGRIGMALTLGLQLVASGVFVYLMEHCK